MLDSNKEFRLQILNHNEVFADRETANSYIVDYLKPEILMAEPAVALYGDKNSPDALLVIGTGERKMFIIDTAKIEEDVKQLSESTQEGIEAVNEATKTIKSIISACGLNYDTNKIEDQVTYVPDYKDVVIGDAKNLAEAVNLLSKYAQELSKNTQFKTQDTNSVKLTFKDDDESNSKVLKAKVKISDNGDSDSEGFNNNIIGIKADGLYAAAHLEYDELRNELKFYSSGTKDGRFQDDAKKQIIKLGKHLEIVANNKDENPIKVKVKAEDNTAKVSANISLSELDNIIKIVDGKLKAMVSLSYNEANNQLVFSNGIENKVINLSSGSVVERSYYDANTETIVIVFKLANGNTSDVKIPVRGILNEWGVENNGNTVTLTKTIDNGSGKDTLSADVNVSTKADNILVKDGSSLYVGGVSSNIRYKETTVAKTLDSLEKADEKLAQDLLNEINARTNDIGAVVNKIEQEVADRKHADEDIKHLIEDLDVKGLENVIKDFQSSYAEFEKEWAGYKVQIEKAISDAESVVGRVNELEKKLIEDEANLANLKSNVEENKANIGTLSTSVAGLRNELENEVTRATVEEKRIETKIDSLVESTKTSLDSALEQAKNYTDAEVLKAKNSISEDTASKINKVLEDAKTYSDNQLALETSRAQEKEQANADAISELKAKDAEIEANVAKKIESVTIEKNSQSDLQYTLYVDEKPVGEINIPKDQFLKDVRYDVASKSLIFTWELGDNHPETSVDVSDFINTYYAGSGLAMNENTFSVKLTTANESYLQVTEDGIQLVGIDAKFDTKADKSDTYTKLEVENAVESEAIRAKSIEEGLQSSIEATNSNVNTLLESIYTKTDVDKLISATKTEVGYINDADPQLVINSEIRPDGHTLYKIGLTDVAKESEIDSVKQKNDELSQNLNALTSDYNNFKFNVGSSDTVDMSINSNDGGRTLVGNVKNIAMEYDKPTNTITLKVGNNSTSFELAGAAVVKSGYYDSSAKELVLVIEGGDNIRIPAADLFNELTTADVQNSPVRLVITRSADGRGRDVIEAFLNISTVDTNLIHEIDNGSLYASRMAADHTCVFGDEGKTISVQEALSTIYSSIKPIIDAQPAFAEQFENLKDQVKSNTSRIEALEDNDEWKEEINNLKENVTNLQTTIEKLEKLIGGGENQDGTSIMERIESIETILQRMTTDFGTYAK